MLHRSLFIGQVPERASTLLISFPVPNRGLTCRVAICWWLCVIGQTGGRATRCNILIGWLPASLELNRTLCPIPGARSRHSHSSSTYKTVIPKQQRRRR